MSNTTCLGLARKSLQTLSLDIPIVFILSCLVFASSEAKAIAWQAQGPSPIYDGAAVIPPPPGAHPSHKNPVVGAIQSVLIDPKDEKVMYIGAVNGGIWKTTDGSATWTPLTDTLTSLSMGGMALDPGNSSRILAGIGQFSNSGQSGPRAGVIFSGDAGATWKSLGGAVLYNTNVSSVVVKDQLMFVASRTRNDTPEVVTGLFRSTDGGTSFIQISGSGGLPLGSVTSLASDPGNDNRLYAAVQNSGIYRSDDRGKTWTNITPANSGIDASTAFIRLSVGAGGKSLVMGLTSGGEKTTRLQSVWHSLDQGATWRNMGGQGSGPGQGLPGTIENGQFVGINNDGQGKINFALLADAKNPNIVYISGDDQPTWDQLAPSTTRKPFPNQIGAIGHNASVYRGDAGRPLSSPPAVDNWTPDNPKPFEGQWLPITDNFTGGGTTPHADSRSLAFDARGNLLGTDDGGIYRRSDPQRSTGDWTSLLGNLQITEMWSIAYDSNRRTLIYGAQDNGAGNQDTAHGKIWTAQVLADGGITAVNDQDPAFSVWYMDSQDLGSFTRIKVDAKNNFDKVLTKFFVVMEDGKTVPLKTGEGSNIPRRAAVRLNQADKTRLAIGADEVYLAKDDVRGKLGPDLYLTSINVKPFTLETGVNPVIAFGRPGNANLLLAGEGKNLWLSTTLQRRSLRQLETFPRALGKNYITSVSLNANSDNHFYVADSSVVRSTSDQGKSWVTGLALSQLQSLQFIANGLNAVVAGGYGTLYAARDTDLNNWYSLKGDLPNTFIWEMDYSNRDDTLAVGTLGRGAFTLAKASTLMPPKPTSVDTGWIRLLRKSSPDQTLNGGTVQNPDSADLGNLKKLTLTTLGGTFDTNGPNLTAGTDSTLTALITGPGSLTVTGNGTLTLQNPKNDYAGGTNLNGGAVVVTRDANLGAATGKLSFDGGILRTTAALVSARSISLLSRGTLDTFGSTSAMSLSGVISGPGGTLTKMGNGTLSLTGLNTYSGGTILGGGILQVSQDANLGAAGGPLTFSGGALQVVPGLAGGGLTSSRTLVVLAPLVPVPLGRPTFDTGPFASVCSGGMFGNGTFTQTGTGSLTLNGDGSPFTGTYTLISGALTLNNGLGSTLGPCSLVVNPGSTFGGSGTVVGNMDLQGDGSGFSGRVVVPAANIFQLNRTLGSRPAPCFVEVNPGGLITGGGTLAGRLTNQGTINPGNSPGTLSVVGSYAQTAGATFTAEIASPGSYDKITVTGAPGTASLAGTLAPVLLGGYQPLRNTVFPGVVTASGGITGAFGSVANPVINPTMSWQTRSTGTSVDLAAVPDFANAGLPLTKNHQNVGVMLNDLNAIMGGDLGQVLHVISQLPTGPAVADAYQQIAPDKASALPSLSLAGSMMQWQSVANRLSYQRWRRGGMPTLAAGRSGSFNLSYNSLAGLMLAYNGTDFTGLTGGRQLQADSAGPWGIFTDFVSSFGTKDSTANLTGYNFSIFGFTVGGDYRFRDDLVFGLGSGYYNTSASYKGSGGNAAINSIPFYAYGAYTPGSFYAMGYLGYTLNLYSLNRNITFGAINRVASGSPGGNQLNVSLETGYDLKLTKFTLTPAFTLHYSTAWVNSFTEEGAGSLNLRVGAQSADSVQTGLGMRLSRPFQSGTIILLPQIFAFYQHEFADNSRGLDARLAQAGNTFLFQTDSPSRNFALLGAGLAAGLSKNLTLQANYNVEVGRGGYTPHVVSAGLRYEF